MRNLAWLVVIAVLAALAVLGSRFAAANEELITVRYLLGELTGVPIWLALLGSGALGAAIALVLTSLPAARAGMRGRRYRRQVSTLEAEVHKLRRQPLEPARADAPPAADVAERPA